MATKLVGQDGTPVKYQGKEIFSVEYSGVVKSVDMIKRTLVMIGTDETKDRDGDIIRLSGWNLDNYKKNPVFLWAHNYGSVPLARAEKVTKKKEPPRMEFQLVFPTKGIYPFADMILELYMEKIINASSVGFIPTKWNPIEEDKNDSDRRNPYGREYISQELLELSGCPVPSNPSAVQNALKGKNFGFRDDDLLKYLTGATLIPRPDKEDDIVEEMVKSETEIVDETSIQVQVSVDLQSSDKDLILSIDLEKGVVEYLKEVPAEGAELLEKEEGMKPYPNEHACRIMDPSEFDKFARKNCFRKVDGKCVDYIFGIKDDKTHLQALRFNKDVWTEAGAKGVCERAGGKFEAAKPPKSNDPPSEENIDVPPEIKDTNITPVVDELETPEEKATMEEMNARLKKCETDIKKCESEIKKLMMRMDEMDGKQVSNTESFISISDQIKGIQDSLAKALEEFQRMPKGRENSSSLILREAFDQGKKKDPKPKEKFSKESLEGLKSAVMELNNALKGLNLTN